MRVIFERMTALAEERVGLGDLGRFTEVRWDKKDRGGRGTFCLHFSIHGVILAREPGGGGREGRQERDPTRRATSTPGRVEGGKTRA